MIELRGEEAFGALRDALAQERPAASFRCGDLAFERLRRGIDDGGLSSADRLVRLRHALRFASLSLSKQARRTFPSAGLGMLERMPNLERYGLYHRSGGWVEALPWNPNWLQIDQPDGVDAAAMAGVERPWIGNPPLADPWLKKVFGRSYYRGPGQALAVRAALHMSAENALVVILPTGEGKSLVFQSLAAANPGKTIVVVVPTVTLAQDHDASVREFSALGTHPHAYLGGETEVNAGIRERIVSGTQGLVFAAPEAATGSLRGALNEAARAGRLAALVVDEAHLVDAWGTDFRSEFQMLSGLVVQLGQSAPEDLKPRVICLSATVTQMAFDTLRSLFSSTVAPGLAAAPRLRPEPDIWIDRSRPNQQVRIERVLESLRHLPRPAIVYVTLPPDAEEWKTRLQMDGYARLAVVHGRTDTAERERVVQKFRAGDLDIVVGTSAFGLGIDYAHVRTVIHACLPESLDRYYQEIGRSGRDNKTSIAILISTPEDKPQAKMLSDAKVISVEKGLGRWRAMFAGKTRDTMEYARYIIDLRTSPGYDPDMRSGRNEDWNARVLNLMTRAGLIRLSGLGDATLQESKIMVEILNDAHLEQETWNTLVAPIRQQIQRASQRAFDAMCEFGETLKCPSNLLVDLYRLDDGQSIREVTSACGGCSECRASGRRWFADWPQAPDAPWPVGRFDELRFNFFSAGICFVQRGTNIESRTEKRRLQELIDALWRNGWRKCVVVGEAQPPLLDHLARVPWCVAVGEDHRILASNGLPPGPELVWVGSPGGLATAAMAARSNDSARLFVVPPEFEDPREPGRLLSERLPIPHFSKVLEWIDR